MTIQDLVIMHWSIYFEIKINIYNLALILISCRDMPYIHQNTVYYVQNKMSDFPDQVQISDQLSKLTTPTPTPHTYIHSVVIFQ